MKCAISNIAWLPHEARRVYALMQRHGFAGLEVAPGLALPDEADPFRPSAAGVRAFRADCAEFGLTPVSMQSLLFGATGAQLFGAAAECAALEAGIERAIGLAELLGIPNLVFGSPRNRAYPDGMSRDAALDQAATVFARLGDKALAAGAVLAIEPNPASYGTNFLTTLAEAADFVTRLAHPGVTLNYDIGALLAEGEDAHAAARYAAARGRVSHVHISEPELAPAPADAAGFAAIARQLAGQGYQGWFSIEMRRPERDALAVIEACLRRVAGARQLLENPTDA